MHNVYRTIFAAGFLVLFLSIAPSALRGMLPTLDERHGVAHTLQETIKRAAQQYKTRGALQYQQRHTERTLEEQRERFEELSLHEPEVARQLLHFEQVFSKAESAFGFDPRNREDLAAFAREARASLSRVMRSAYTDDVDTHALLALLNPHQALDAVLTTGDSVSHWISVLRSLSSLQEAIDVYANLEGLHTDMALEIAKLEENISLSENALSRSGGQIEENRRIMAEVHSSVLRLQSELARIDARLREKAMRALIEKGLAPPVDTKDPETWKSFTPTFSWPAYGTISAGFHDAGYVRVFGVAHEGVDIVVPQESPVFSAADGIVFLVRDGGETGYTYVLIGHRGGYATLYGHLSSVSIQPGQEVTAGQQIGLSGGQPGTYGAGPMTTGAHLHFEVIQGGKNVDPMSVL